MLGAKIQLQIANREDDAWVDCDWKLPSDLQHAIRSFNDEAFNFRVKPAPPKVYKKWMNIYTTEDHTGQDTDPDMHATREDADEHASGTGLTRIACIEVSFQEGQGV